MERMTKRTSDGQAVMDCKKCKADWTEKHGESMEECTALYCRNRLKDRVAAYEDTRLTPAEVRSMYGEWNAMMSVLNSIGSYARLRELAEADKDGRVVVPPCKVGDTLYEVTSRKTISEYCVKAIRVELFCVFIEWEIMKGFVDKSISGVVSNEIGKTVFLTHEEAEKAVLEAKRNEGM